MPYARTRWHIRKIDHCLLEQSNNRRIRCHVNIPFDVEIIIARGNGRRNIGLHSVNPVFLIMVFLNDSTAVSARYPHGHHQHNV